VSIDTPLPVNWHATDLAASSRKTILSWRKMAFPQHFEMEDFGRLAMAIRHVDAFQTNPASDPNANINTLHRQLVGHV
tara:strand:- start:33 stop:266 length:234 start_codon:yes stop_codon:yes gene_type:complete